MEDKEKINEINATINAIDNKEFKMYFFTLDTKGNPTAGIANIYEHVKVLRELGYDANILHEKDDYHGVSEWLGETYAELPHVSIEKQDLNISTKDFIVIPEIFANVMEQIKGFPCKKIVLSQAYNYVLDLLPIGKRWGDFGFFDIITTSNKQATYLNGLFPNLKTHVVPVSIPKYFKPTKLLKEPTVAIVCREQTDAVKIVKAFYLQNPTYKWVTFKELRGLPRESFAEELSKSCLSVWVDEVSGYGTFPLESMECDTPCIGKIPNLIPEWMEDSESKDEGLTIKNNGIWTNNYLNIPELIATYMKVWLEDSVPTDLSEAITETKGKHTAEMQYEKIKEVYSTIFENRKNEFETMLKSETEKIEK